MRRVFKEFTWCKNSAVSIKHSIIISKIYQAFCILEQKVQKGAPNQLSLLFRDFQNKSNTDHESISLPFSETVTIKHTLNLVTGDFFLSSIGLKSIKSGVQMAVKMFFDFN